jgi:putative nucleic acid modification protein with dual OB domain
MKILDFVCLANSQKHNGRCIAGITAAGEWVRPVSPDPDGTLYPQQYTLTDGSEPSVLDVIRLEATPRPEPHQPENWRISGARWRRLGRLSEQQGRQSLHKRATPGPHVLGSLLGSVSYDYLIEHPMQASLCLVEPGEILWHVRTNYRGNRQIRAIFSLTGAQHNLPVTDPIWTDRHRNLGFGSHQSHELGIAAGRSTFLTVSLAEPFNGYCYKLIAAVIVL